MHPLCPETTTHHPGLSLVSFPLLPICSPLGVFGCLLKGQKYLAWRGRGTTMYDKPPSDVCNSISLRAGAGDRWRRRRKTRDKGRKRNMREERLHYCRALRGWRHYTSYHNTCKGGTGKPPDKPPLEQQHKPHHFDMKRGEAREEGKKERNETTGVSQGDTCVPATSQKPATTITQSFR